MNMAYLALPLNIFCVVLLQGTAYVKIAPSARKLTNALGSEKPAKHNLYPSMEFNTFTAILDLAQWC
jgi:hypothetical protein